LPFGVSSEETGFVEIESSDFDQRSQSPALRRGFGLIYLPVCAEGASGWTAVL